MSPSIPDDSISCIVTSPPYWAKRNYTGESIIWYKDGICLEDCEHEWDIRKVTLAHENRDFLGKSVTQEQALKSGGANVHIFRNSKLKAGFCTKCGAWQGQLGHEPTVTLYIKHLMQIFDEMYRILRKDGNLFVVIADTRSRGTRPKQANWEDSLRKAGDESSEPDLKPEYKLPSKSQCCVPEIFKLAMMSRGWIARSTYIWIKTNPKPESVKDRFTDCFEYVYHFIKYKRYYFDIQYEPAVCSNDRRAGKGRIEYNGKHLGEEGTGERAFVSVDTLRQMRGAFIGPIQPYKGAHFATYPEWLIEPLIKAGCPKWICKGCGKVAPPVYNTQKIKRKRLHDTTEPCKEAGQSPNDYEGTNRWLEGYDICDCAAGFRTGVVFDPFAGAGTTFVVAEKLGLCWGGIELSKQYIKMSYRRLIK